MQTLFECTVRYSKPVEGTDEQKRVSEVYLFDALTYTEAEKRAYEKLPEFIQGEFQVTGIRKARYAEVIPCEAGGYWYKVKISFILVDENSGKEKRVSQTVLTLAEEVKAVNESAILDFFPYMERRDDAPADREIARRPASQAELDAAKANH